MAFVLIAVTNGDDLISSRRIEIATGDNRDQLDRLAEQRKAEADAWLAKLGSGVLEGSYGTLLYPNLVHHYEVIEVPSL